MKRWLLKLLLGWACTTLVVALAVWAYPTVITPTWESDPLRLEQVQRLEQLLTTRVRVEQRQVRTLKGRLGELRVTLWVEGEILLGPEFSTAELERVNERHRTATVVLNRPRVISARVDLSRSRFEGVSFTGLWWVLPDPQTRHEMEARSLRHAETALQLGAASAWERAASEQTERVVERFGTSIGWSLGVRWRP